MSLMPIAACSPNDDARGIIQRALSLPFLFRRMGQTATQPMLARWMPMFRPSFTVLLVTLTASCSGGPLATAPSTPIAANATAGVLSAALAVSTFSVTRRSTQPLSDWVLYDVKLRLTETSGKSGATLKAVGLSVPMVGTDLGCTQSQHVRISPGETWDMDSLGYCAPEVSIHKSVGTEIANVSLFVTFADDVGRIGSISVAVTAN